MLELGLNVQRWEERVIPAEGLVSAGTDGGNGVWHGLSKGVAGARIIKTRCYSNHFACM